MSEAREFRKLEFLADPSRESFGLAFEQCGRLLPTIIYRILTPFPARHDQRLQALLHPFNTRIAASPASIPAGTGVCSLEETILP